MRSCDYDNCKIPAECCVVWGYDNSKINLCFYHIEQLWEKYRSHVLKTHESLNWQQFPIKDNNETI